MKYASAFGAVLAFLLWSGGCTDLDRTNPLDPQNPESVRTQVVLAELFVNDSIPGPATFDTTDRVSMVIDTVTGDTTWDTTGIIDTVQTVLPASADAETALYRLYEEYGYEKLVVVQYHVGEQHLADPYITDENMEYYTDYSTHTMVPELFLNGPRTSVSWPVTADEYYTDVKEALSFFINRSSHLTLEASLTISADSLVLSGTAARLGTVDAPQLYATYLFLRDTDLDHHRFVVLQPVTGITVPQLKAGKTVSLPSRSIPNAHGLAGDDVRAVMYVKNKDDEILQAVILGAGL